MAEYDGIYTLQFLWTVSKSRGTEGHDICTLYVDGNKKTTCTGGGFDMIGECLGSWAEKQFIKELLTLKEPYYGLSFGTPIYNRRKKIVGSRDRSVLPTNKHTVPRIDGDHGKEAVMNILNAIGYEVRCLQSDTYYIIEVGWKPCQTK